MNPGVRQNHQDACGGNEPVPARSDRITEGAGGGIAPLVKVVSGREFARSRMGAGDCSSPLDPGARRELQRLIG
jgi:hypothetical protein